MNPKPTPPQFTDADLDRALSTGSDSILPSSGFAENVMAAVHEETSVPAPIPFPWKRAVPGFIAIAAAIGLLLAVIPATLHSAFTAPHPAASPILWHSIVPALVSHGNNATWISASVAICLACLLFCRRLIAPR
jgi:hypothetical protein